MEATWSPRGLLHSSTNVYVPVNVWWAPEWCALKHLGSRYVTFNRFCEAKPNPEQNFTCFDFNPDTDMESYLANYLNAATAVNPNCTMDNISPTYNEFDYNESGLMGMHSYAPTCTINDTYGDCAHLGSSVYDLDDYERMRAVMSSSRWPAHFKWLQLGCIICVRHCGCCRLFIISLDLMEKKTPAPGLIY